MKTAIPAILLAAFLALPVASAAQDAPEAAGEKATAEIPEAKEKAIRRFMEITGATDYGQQLADNMISQVKPAFPDVPDSRWAEIEESLDTSAVTERVVPIYSRHFDLEELKALNEFYSTPVGQQVLKKLPLVMQESMQTGQAWGRAKMQEIVEKLSEEGYEPTRP